MIGLKVSEKLLTLTHNLSPHLQSQVVDLSSAIRHVETISRKCPEMRNSVEEEFSKLFNLPTKVGVQVGIPQSIPRLVGTELHRKNYRSILPEKYYIRALSTPSFR